MLRLTHLPLVPQYASVNEVSNGCDNGLSSIRRQAIIWTSGGFLSTRPLGTKFCENLIEIQNFSFTKMHLKILSAKRRPFYAREPLRWVNTRKPEQSGHHFAHNILKWFSIMKNFIFWFNFTEFCFWGFNRQIINIDPGKDSVPSGNKLP